MLKAAKAYLVTQVSTASQGDLLLMLYDTAIKHLRQAIDKMRAGDVAAKGVLITKALAIISELQESLNKDRGGDISKNLFQLYFFCNSRLLMANLKMRPEIVEEVITILSGLRQAFAQILPTQDGVASLAQPTAAVAGPGAETAKPAVPSVPPAAQTAAPAAPVTPTAAAPDVPEVPAAPAPPPVNTLRLRAASAYAHTR
jgi:flagellar protein FliS